MNLRSTIYSIFILTAIVFATSSCQEDTYVSDAELIAAEERIFLQFLSENFDAYCDRSAVIDTLYKGNDTTFVKVFGHKDSVDLVYWSQENGVGDTITSGQQVGFRCKEYILKLNSEADSIELELDDSSESYGDLYENDLPASIIIDQTNQGYLVPYFGLNEGFQHMKLNGKAWMLIPSSQTRKDYYSRFYEIEVFYVSR